MLLRWQRGELSGYFEGRCHGTNLCDYCAIQAAHENARMLGLDALADTRPRLLAIVGTRTPITEPRPFYRAREAVIRSLRREFGRGVEYSSLLELTTGKGPRSGGLRRPHWNLFLKGIEPDRLVEARAIVREAWCSRIDADPAYQYVELLQNAGAAANYVAKHFHKREQALPPGWRGQRFNCSRGYFGDLTRAQAREQARESLQADREIFKVRRGAEEQGLELTPEEIVTVAEHVREWNAGKTWRLVAVSPQHAERLLAGLPSGQDPRPTARTEGRPPRTDGPDEARGAPDGRPDGAAAPPPARSVRGPGQNVADGSGTEREEGDPIHREACEGGRASPGLLQAAAVAHRGRVPPRPPSGAADDRVRVDLVARRGPPRTPHESGGASRALRNEPEDGLSPP